MKKIIYFTVGILILLGIITTIFVLQNTKQQKNIQINEYKNISYIIDGNEIKLTNGISEIEAAPGSASKISTKYFGNDILKDLDDDGRPDVVFLLTQETGGSGTFFYVVAALNKTSGYVGSEAYFLGDRIAPQTTESGPNKSIIVNYADRLPSDPMTAQPSIGKSIYLELDPQTMKWNITSQNPENTTSIKKQASSTSSTPTLNLTSKTSNLNVEPKKNPTISNTSTQNNTSPSQNPLSDFTTYDSVIGFSISYPTGWFITETTEGEKFSGLIEFTSSKNLTDMTRQSFVLSAGKSIKPISLQDIKKEINIQSEKNILVEDKFIKVNGQDAYEIIGTQENKTSEQKVKVFIVFLPINNNGSNLNGLTSNFDTYAEIYYSATIDNFNQLLAEKMMNSIKIK